MRVSADAAARPVTRIVECIAERDKLSVIFLSDTNHISHFQNSEVPV